MQILCWLLIWYANAPNHSQDVHWKGTQMSSTHILITQKYVWFILHVHIRQKIEKYGGDFMLVSFFFKLMNIHNKKIILFTLNIP